MSSFSEELFNRMPVVGILRGYSPEDVWHIATAYYEAGFTNIEVTMNTPEVCQAIKLLVDHFEGKLNVGAGTVCTMATLNEALDAGSQFIITPILNIQIIEECIRHTIPVFPGAFTPTEIYRAWELGAKMVKVFPASLLGPKYIKEILAPLDHIELMPTGGVDFSNIPDYLSAGAKAFGMGSFLFNKELIKKKDWSGLADELAITNKKLDAYFKS